MRSRVAREVSAGSSLRREKAVRDDFAVRLRRRDLAERAHDIERDMIAPRHAAVEIDRVQNRRLGQLDIALLAQFALQRRQKRFAVLDAAAGQMPAGDIAVLDQEDAAFAVEYQRRARRAVSAARKAPIEVQEPPDRRLERAADASSATMRVSMGAMLLVLQPTCLIRIILIYDLNRAEAAERPPVKRFADLSEQEILALAISNEDEDNRIYRSFADAAARPLSRHRGYVRQDGARRRSAIATCCSIFTARNSATFCR